ncbi:MAG: hypothetical protein GX279_00150 [Clostridiaceae bacterium]|jgi:hypothetical protein|nr:hypothetical protein [Clostridiaceae bacterium]
MLYRNDYTGKKTAETQLNQYMPSAGTFSGMHSMPQSQSMHGGMMAGQQGGMQIPGSTPAAGAITYASPTTVSAGGMPSVPSSMQGILPSSVTHPGNQVPSTVENTFFTPGFLRTQIGRRMRVEFLLGTNLLTDRTGTLVAVGASYIVLKLIDSDDLMMCDIYSIKFVTIIL